MIENKTVLISGISGQDGSILTRKLLELGCKVHGIIRRSSTFNTSRLDDIYVDSHDPKASLFLHYGDLTDSSSINDIVMKVKPDFIFHLGAMSHVRVSFDIPEYTMDVVGTGTMRMLEAARKLNEHKKVRFYNASSSEQYGRVLSIPQTLSTPFNPRSPYGCAKVAAHHATVNYREAYGLFACNGILYNHECLTYNMPVLIRRDGYIDITQVGDLVAFSSKGKNKQTTEIDGLEVWDSNKFVKVTHVTASRYNGSVRKIVSRMGVLETTPEHVWLKDDSSEVNCGDISKGDRLEISELPNEAINFTRCTNELAWLLGVMCADGSITNGSAKFINKDDELLNRVSDLWMRVSGGSVLKGYQVSGFTGRKDIGYLSLSGDRKLLNWIEENIYTNGTHGSSKLKKVPKLILNSSSEVIKTFLDGYCAGDGTKSLSNAAYEFQYFTTNSPVLALGLRVCISLISGVNVTYNVYGPDNNIYKGQIWSERADGKNGQIGKSGYNLMKDHQEVIKIIDSDYDGWVFDLATESGKFTAGTGLIRVHNSEYRGETFVTRKITTGLARIKCGLQDKLFLGNLEAKRDWGYAGDYMDAVIKIVCHTEPDDFIISTNETHTVREFLDLAGEHLGIDWKKHVEIDAKYFRPTEVDILLGDNSKAVNVLGWKPTVSFKQLVQLMCDYDYKRISS